VPKITFLINTYNQFEYLKFWVDCLDWIYENKFQDFELIISDDGSVDKTQEFIKTLKNSYPVNCYYLAGTDFHRQLCIDGALRLAKGKFIYLFDADTFIKKETFSALLRELTNNKENENEILWGTRVRIDWGKLNNFGLKMDFLEKSVVKTEFNNLKSIPPAKYRTFAGSNVLISREKFLEIDGMPKDFNGYGYEDYYILLKFLALGMRVKFIPDLVSYHVMHKNTVASKENEFKLIKLEGELFPKIKAIHPDFKE
jgi:GT2 family glycosyltransferase